MKSIIIFTMIALTTAQSVSSQENQSNTGVFDKKVEQSKWLLVHRTFPKLNSIISFQHVENVLRCGQLIAEKKPKIDLAKYSTTILEYPKFFSAIMIRDSNAGPEFDDIFPLVAGQCDFEESGDQIYVTFGSQASPLYQEFEKNYLGRRGR